MDGAGWRAWCRLVELLGRWGVPPIGVYAWAAGCPAVWRTPGAYPWWEAVRARLRAARFRPILLRTLAVGWPCPPGEAPTHTLMAGGRYGRLYVPPEQRETFHEALWRQLRGGRGALTLVERKGPRWRLVLDVDLGGGGATLAQLAEEPRWTAALLDVLAAAFEGWPWAAHVERSPVRLQPAAGGWRWKQGLRVFTPAVVDAAQAGVLQAYVERRLVLPSWYVLDAPVSWGAGGALRVPGCWKVVACHRPSRRPTVDDYEEDLRCDLCNHSNLLLGAPPYATGPDWATWRGRLLWPGDEPVWRVAALAASPPSPPAAATAPAAAERIRAGLRRKREAAAAVDALERRHVRRLVRRAPDPPLPGVRAGGRDPAPVPPGVAEGAPALLSRLHAALADPARIVCIRRTCAGFYFFRTDCRACPFRRGEHRSNTLYVLADPVRRRLSLRCFDGEGPCARGAVDLPHCPDLLALLWPEGLRRGTADGLNKF